MRDQLRAERGQVTHWAYVATLAAGWTAMLVANLPGHLTLDSLLELYEGRYRVRQSWAPSFYAWVLGAFDGLWRGTGLYVAASGLLLFAALASLAWLRGRTSRWAVVAAAMFSLSPLVLIYQAIVWKDVLFANTAIAGMICLAWALQRWAARWPRVLLLLAALVLLAAAALLRQNGIIVGVFAAAALGWGRAAGRWTRAVAWALGGLVAVVLVSHAMNLATQPDGRVKGDGMREGMAVLQGYDLLGALALDPAFPLTAVTRAAPSAAQTLRKLAPRYYSPERIDFADAQPQIAEALLAIPEPALAADWRALILRHPWLYLRVRTAVFAWVFLTPDVERCVPVCLGVQGTQAALEGLGMQYRWSDQDDRLLVYDRAFLRTPVYSHLAYALLALGAGVVLLLRRDRADGPMIALLASGLAFAASFFAISIACDFRYLYFLDLAAMAGLIYVAVDPPGARRSVRQQRV